MSKSSEDTFRLGVVLGGVVRAGDVVALTGELGSGKTVLTQGIAKGLGVPACYTVTSPTFTLINEYPGKETTLYHMDVYRLAGIADLDEMGYEEYIWGEGVMVVEWAERIRDAIPSESIFIAFAYIDENVRGIEISGCREMIAFLEMTLREGGF